MDAEHPLDGIVDNLVYGPVQLHEAGVDLTVGAVYEVTNPGRLDFGGDELEDAELEPVETIARDPDDEYEWWTLEVGHYVIQHNEFLAEDDVELFLQARNDLLARGGSHPSLVVEGHLPLVPLSVGGAGLSLKENARVSTLRTLPGVTGAPDDERLGEVTDI